MDQDLQQLLSQHSIIQVHSTLYKEMLDTYIYLSSVYNSPICCIYGIYHTSTKKCIYIGATLDLHNRIPWHHYEYNIFPNRKLYKEIQEGDGWNSYSFKLLESLQETASLFIKEKYYIHLLSPSTNMLSPPNKILQ
jgi:hypothetical protein